MFLKIGINTYVNLQAACEIKHVGMVIEMYFPMTITNDYADVYSDVTVEDLHPCWSKVTIDDFVPLGEKVVQWLSKNTV